MTITRNELVQILYACLTEANEQRAVEAQFPLSEATMLIGGSSGLDSLGVINLISGIEEKLDTQFGLKLSLPAFDTLEDGRDAWTNVGTLADAVAGHLKNRAGLNR